MLPKISEPKRNKTVGGDRRKRHKEELHGLYSSPDIVQ
jgi:hypothetical protein